MKKTIKRIIFLMLLLIIISGCKAENNNLESKTNEEINYLEFHILTIVNKYAKGEYNQGEEILWDEMEKEANKINNEIDTVMLDFTEYNVSKEELINFRNGINDLLLSIKNKNEEDVINKCNNLYALLTIIFEKSSNNNLEKSMMEIDSLILSSFNYSNSLDWDNAKKTIDIAIGKFLELYSNVDAMEEYSNNLNKTYILIEEMKNAIYSEQLDLVKVKYLATEIGT